MCCIAAEFVSMAMIGGVAAMRRAWGDSCVGSKGRFLKKAAQKFLAMLGHGQCRGHRPRPSIKKFFCFFLFTKRSLP
jgi:hypothetical protein